MESDQSLIALVMAYPKIALALSLLAMLSPVFTALSALAQKWVDSTVDKSDDEVLVKVKGSLVYRALSFILDAAISVKLPEKKIAAVVVSSDKSAA